MFLPRSFLPAIFALVALMVAVGAPGTSLPVLTRAVALALPAALALPVGLPSLWLPGVEPWGLWAVNVLAAVVLLAVVWRSVTRVAGRGDRAPQGEPAGSRTRGQVWRRVVGGVVIGLVLANVVRAVVWSLYTGPSLTIYASTVALTAVVSALVGLVVGAVIGLVAAAFTPSSAPEVSPATGTR